MVVYKISRAPFADDLSGEGARLYGGRWNSKGVPVLYTSEHESLAALEVLVNTPVYSLPNDLMCVVLELPDTDFTEIVKATLPENWFHYPAPDLLKKRGDDWVLEQQCLSIKVPSCIIHNEWNVLINPRHPLMKAVKLVGKRPFRFDTRLIQ